MSALPPDNLGRMPQDYQLKRAYAEQYGPLCKSLQDRRRTVEEGWLRNRDSWMARHRRQGFQGEWFNHFIPASRRALERFTTRCKQLLFPSPDYFEVYPADDRRPDLGAQSEAWKNYLLWRMWRVRIRSIMLQVIRCYGLYQRGIVKSYLDFDDIPGEVWPSVRAVDPFTFYVWPETATAMNQVQVAVEHTMMPYDRYVSLAQQGACDPIQSSDLTKPEWPYYYVERLGQAGLPTPTDMAGGRAYELIQGGTDPQQLVALTEVWRREGATWLQLWLVWNVKNGPLCTRIQPGLMSPFRMAIARQLPGEHYTSCMMSDLESLNVLLNDEVNMTLEGQATALFPPAAVNPDLVARADSLVFKPRAKWLVDPAGVSFVNVPNTTGAGYQGIQMTMGLLDSFSGSNPLAEGSPTRGMPRAGFAVSSLIGLSMSDIREVAETMEDEILTPMLSDFARLTRERIPPQQIARVPGSEALAGIGGQIQVGQLDDASFRWVGTLQAQDQQVRAQRMLAALGQFAKLFPAMNEQGWTFDFGTLGKRVWRDGLGERGADTIIIRNPNWTPPVPGQPGQAQGATPGQPGTGGAQPLAPATPEAAQRQLSRGMSETGAAPQLTGIGQG